LKQQLKRKQHPLVFQILAQNYYANKQVTAALEATSHQYELEGYLQLAAQQIDYALKQTNLNPSTQQRLISRKEALLNKLSKEKGFSN
ncbi:MAG: hypothetical protein OQK70_03280, partial [Gammaproteobacteria bacterium]|nr:hypothetical protein [Gammaproteobacteria bacterium]